MTEDFSKAAVRLFNEKLSTTMSGIAPAPKRAPVHVVYGGANLFSAETVGKLGRIAQESLAAYAPNFAEFGQAVWLKGAEKLSLYAEPVLELEKRLTDDADAVKSENYDAWFVWTIYRRVLEKLKTDAVEDFRIDFEDGYGIRSDEEEDSHAVGAASELARAFFEGTLPFTCGFRIKSFQNETYARSVRTLQIFLTTFLEKTSQQLPPNFVVTLPKITRPDEVAVLGELLAVIEQNAGLAPDSIGVEAMIETTDAVRNMRGIAEAGGTRLVAAHFGAFDYTANLGITATHQHLQHDACRFARQMMQVNLASLGIRLSDSVTTEMPVPVHRGKSLTKKQIDANKRAVHNAWRKHFNNVTSSLIDGFYQSWDLHPNQLVPRYAALYSFFLESADAQAERLKGFIGKATQAMLTGNQFDDAASALGLLNFFVRAAGCGAMTEDEITQKTDLSPEELRSASFSKIMFEKWTGETD